MKPGKLAYRCNPAYAATLLPRMAIRIATEAELAREGYRIWKPQKKPGVHRPDGRVPIYRKTIPGRFRALFLQIQARNGSE